jgi:hypothetical protein
MRVVMPQMRGNADGPEERNHTVAENRKRTFIDIKLLVTQEIRLGSSSEIRLFSRLLLFLQYLQSTVSQ